MDVDAPEHATCASITTLAHFHRRSQLFSFCIVYKPAGGMPRHFNFTFPVSYSIRFAQTTIYRAALCAGYG